MADLVSKLAEGVTCSICHECYRNPKVLGCLHRFCRDCLQQYINSKGRDTGIVCPECRRITSPPVPRSGSVVRLANWADHFPTDFLVKSMVDNLKTQQKKSDDCSVHSGNPMVLFCQDCRKMICHVCAGVDHRKCERVVPLRQEAEKKREHLRKHQCCIKKKWEISKSNSENIKGARSDLISSYDRAVKEVKTEYLKIQKLVKERADLCLKNLRDQQSTEDAFITIAGVTQKTLGMELMVCDREIGTALRTKSDSQIVQEKVRRPVPDIQPKDFKRQRPNYEHLFKSVIKKAKFEETKTFLEHK